MSATDVAVNLIYEEATHNAEHRAQATGTLSSTGFTGASPELQAELTHVLPEEFGP